MTSTTILGGLIFLARWLRYIIFEPNPVGGYNIFAPGLKIVHCGILKLMWIRSANRRQTLSYNTLIVFLNSWSECLAWLRLYYVVVSLSSCVRVYLEETKNRCLSRASAKTILRPRLTFDVPVEGLKKRLRYIYKKKHLVWLYYNILLGTSNRTQTLKLEIIFFPSPFIIESSLSNKQRASSASVYYYVYVHRIIKCTYSFLESFTTPWKRRGFLFAA